MAFNRDRNNRPGGDRGGFRPRPSFGGSPHFAGGAGRPRFGDRGDRGPVEMHQAVCDNCGRECEVPFRPTSGKPIFCSNCFENQRRASYSRFEKKNDFEEGRNTGTNHNSSNNNQRLDELNTKLDAILKILTTPEIHVETTKKPKASRKSSAKKDIAPLV